MSFECSVGDWHRKKDPTTGAFYYANSETLASCWTVPDGWEEPPAPAGAPPPLTVAESWREATDPVSGNIYYVNTMTMESSWTKPAAMERSSSNENVVRGAAKLDMPQEDPETSEDEMTDVFKREKKSDSHSSSHNYEIKKVDKADASPRLRQAAVLARTPWTKTQKNSEDVQERIRAIKSLLMDEHAYFMDLQVLGAEFETILQTQKESGKEIITPSETKTVFKNLPELFSIHLSFSQLVADVKTDAQILSPGLCELLQQLINSFDPYAQYISHHKRLKTILTYIERLESERPGFKATLDYIKQGKCKSGLVKSFQHYLDAPCSRPAAYGNLILNVLKTMEPNGEGFKLWNDLLEMSEVMATRVEQSAQFIGARDLVVDIQKRLHFVNASEIGLKLVTTTRYLVQSGELKKKLAKSRLGSSYKSYMFYVFNDMAMYTSVPDKLRRIVPKRCMSLLGMKVAASVKDVNFTIDSAVKNVQFKAATKEDRDKWVRVLQEGIKRAAADASYSRTQSSNKLSSMVAPVRGW